MRGSALHRERSLRTGCTPALIPFYFDAQIPRLLRRVLATGARRQFGILSVLFQPLDALRFHVSPHPLLHAAHTHGSLRRCACSGWLLAIAAGALRIPPHPQVSLATPPTSAECVARDRTGCLPAASHTRAHSRFLTRGSIPRALCLEPADHQGRNPLERFDLRSLVPVPWRCGHRVGDRVTRARVEACRGPLLYSGLCTRSRGIQLKSDIL